MPKKVAVQRGLEDIRENLQNLGYEVFDIDERLDVDAIVYMADGYDISYYNQLINMDDGEKIGDRGAILVNATGKSIEEIESIIKNRVYSRIFE